MGLTFSFRGRKAFVDDLLLDRAFESNEPLDHPKQSSGIGLKRRPALLPDLECHISSRQLSDLRRHGLSIRSQGNAQWMTAMTGRIVRTFLQLASPVLVLVLD